MILCRNDPAKLKIPRYDGFRSYSAYLKSFVFKLNVDHFDISTLCLFPQI